MKFFFIQNALLILSSLLLLVFIGSIGGKAYSQMPPGLQIPQTLKQVSGKYVNPEFGLEVTFPDDAQGYEVPYIHGCSFQGSFSVTVNIPAPPLGAEMKVLMINSSKVGSDNSTSTPIDSNSIDPTNCLPTIGSETVNLGGKNAQVSDITTNLVELSNQRNIYVDLGRGKSVMISLNSESSSYNSGLKTFEEILKTVKFTK